MRPSTDRSPRARRAPALTIAVLATLAVGSVCGPGVAPGQDPPPPPAPCSGAPPASGPCPASMCTTDVPGASAYQRSLPVPTPRPGFNYVVQLVNESDVTILAAANAAHRGSSAPGGPVPPPVAVEPREGTWVMLPKGAPDDGNILTIDIPQAWEGTVCPQTNAACGAVSPRFFARTGCKYDIGRNLAQCETGSCGDAYDCGRQALRNPPLASSGRTPVTIVEWTFNALQGYVYPDISLVDGVSLTVDVQAIGLHCASKPGVPTERFWLSENQPLSVHGTDLREPERCIPTFRLTRGEVGQLIRGEGNPDDVVACFTNCGRYEYPSTPPADCDPDADERCRNWLAFCCYTPPGDPSGVYGGTCTNDGECRQSGGCWDTGTPPAMCSCRAFLKNPDCAPDVCTHPWTPENKAAQPPFGRCADVTDDPDACIGDDTVHAVFPGGYTWPNDPQTYVSDARAYRVIFAPGGTTVPITESGEVPPCSSLPSGYGYDTQYGGPGSGDKPCDNEVNVNGARFAGAVFDPASNGTWACNIAAGGPVTTGTLLCRWPQASASPTPTPTRGFGGPPPTLAPGSDSDDGCAVAPDRGGGSGGMLLLLVAVALLRICRRAAS